MKKKLVIFLIVICSVFSLPLFAEETTSHVKTVLENLAKDSTDTTSTTIDEKEEIQTEELSDKQTKKKTKSTLKQITNSTKNLGAIVSSIAGFIENTMTQFEKIIMSPFKFGKNSGATIVFSIVMAIFLILSMAYYIIEIVTNPQFQMREIPMLFFKCIFLICAFYFLPQMAVVLKNFAWRCAEIITGSDVKMEYSIGTRFLSPILMILSGVLGTGLIFGSYFVPAVGSISSLAFGIGFAGALSAMSSTLIYCTWVLELYIATYVLAWYLPSCIFKGFDYRLMNVFKFYFVNTLEVFVGAVIFLIVVKLPINSSFNEGGADFFTMFTPIIKPLIVAIFLPATSKIISAITSGNSLADTSGAAGGAFRRMAGAIGLGAAGHKLGSLISGGKNKMQKAKETKENGAYDKADREINREKDTAQMKYLASGGQRDDKGFKAINDEFDLKRARAHSDIDFDKLNRKERKDRINTFGSEQKAKDDYFNTWRNEE